MKKLLLTLFALITISFQAQNTNLNTFFNGLSSPNRIQYDSNENITYLTESIGISSIQENPTTFQLEKQLIYEIDQTGVEEIFLDDFVIKDSNLYFILYKEVPGSGTTTSEIRKIDFTAIASNATLPFEESDTELIYSFNSSNAFIGFGLQATNNYLFFMHNEDSFARLERIDLAATFPVSATTIVATGFDDADDMAFSNGKLYISDANQIIEVENPESNPVIATTNVFASGFNFLKGIFIDRISDNEFTLESASIYAADGNQIKRAKFDTESPEFETIITNETFSDTNNGSSFFANFRDIEKVNGTILGTLRDQGLIISAEELLIVGLNRPNYLELIGSNLYIQDEQTIFVANLNTFPLAPETVYAAIGENEVSDFSINGNNLYISTFEDPNGTPTSKIIKLDLTNLNSPPQTLFSSTTMFFNLPIQVGNDLFYFEFTSDGMGDFNTALKKSNLDGSNSQTVSTSSVFFPSDIDEKDGKLYFITEPKDESVNDPALIEITIATNAINQIQTFPNQEVKGIDISGNDLYITIDEEIQRANLSDALLNFEIVSLNTGNDDYSDIVIQADNDPNDNFNDTIIYASLPDKNIVIEAFEILNISENPNLNSPYYLEIIGNDLYIQDNKNIHLIDLQEPSRILETLFTASGNEEIDDFSINGSNLYASVAEESNEGFTSKIIKLDLNDFNTSPQTLFSSSVNFFNFPIQVGNDLFCFEFIPDGFGDFNTTLKKSNLDGANPELISMSSTFFPSDIDEKDGNLYFATEPKDSSVNNTELIEVEIATGTITSIKSFPNQEISGVDISGDYLYIVIDNEIQRTNLDDPSVTFEVVATESVKDVITNETFSNVEFSDVVVITSTNPNNTSSDIQLYISSRFENRVLETFLDSSLSIANFNSENSDIKIVSYANYIEVTPIKKEISVTLYSLSGAKITSKKLSKDSRTISTEGLANGIYLFALDNKKAVKFFKF